MKEEEEVVRSRMRRQGDREEDIITVLKKK